MVLVEGDRRERQLGSAPNFRTSKNHVSNHILPSSTVATPAPTSMCPRQAAAPPRSPGLSGDTGTQTITSAGLGGASACAGTVGPFTQILSSSGISCCHGGLFSSGEGGSIGYE